MRIAIIGMGYAGLATAWHLLRSGRDLQITLFAAGELGDGASGASAGLLHPFPGRKANKADEADEAMAAALELLRAADAYGSCWRWFPFLRVPKDARQRDLFISAASHHEELHWVGSKECHQLVPGLLTSEALLEEGAIVVNSLQYLKNLWRCCEAMGAQQRRQKINDLAELSKFDQIIVAAGAGSVTLLRHLNLELRLVEGCSFRMRLPEGSPLDCALGCGKYLVPGEYEGELIAGATFLEVTDWKNQKTAAPLQGDGNIHQSSLTDETATDETATDEPAIGFGKRPVPVEVPLDLASSSLEKNSNNQKKALYSGGGADPDMLPLHPLSQHSVSWKQNSVHLGNLYPAFAKSDILENRHGLRLYYPKSGQKTTRLQRSLWFAGGLGSTGLLQHGLVARRLVSEMLTHY